MPLLKTQPDSLKNVGVRANFVENGTIAQIASVFTTQALGGPGGVYFCLRKLKIFV